MKHRWPVLAIVVATVLVFARLIFASNGVPFLLIPWDFRMLGAPWLIYGWDMIRAGHWPLWCPYAGAGVPFFINPQTHTYAPPSILLGLLFGYSFRLVQLHCVATIALAGVGAYGLSYSIWRSRSAALLSGLCFGLSSTLYSHMEHFPILSAYALAPWLFWAILAAVEKRSRWAMLGIAAIVYSLLTAGYLGVVLMLGPWAAVWLVGLSARLPIRNRERLRVIAQTAFAAGLGVAMAAINWLPFLASASEYTRGDALSLDNVFSPIGSLAPKHFFGMLYSFITSNPFPGVEVDVSMRGIYFGTVAVVLAVVCLASVRGWFVGALATLTLGSLLMSLGGAFFIRLALHILVPIFNMSRFPAGDSRYLAVLGFCVLAGGGALAVARGDETAAFFARRACKYLVVFYLVSIVGLQLLFGKFIDVVVSTVTFEAFCMLLAFVVLWRWQNVTATILLCAIAVLETGYGATANFDPAGQPISKADYLNLSHHEPGFPNAGILSPRLGNEATLNGDTSAAYVGKKFFVSEYNPLRLKRWFALTGAGFGPWLRIGPRVVALPAGSAPTSFAEFAPIAAPVKFDITNFGPNQIDYAVDLPSAALLVFNEMYFPGWKATVDGKSVAVKPLVEGLRSLNVGAGHHAVVFKFRPGLFFVAFGISLAGLVVFLAWALRVRRRRGMVPAVA